jgi:hypothetical protein
MAGFLGSLLSRAGEAGTQITDSREKDEQVRLADLLRTAQTEGVEANTALALARAGDLRNPRRIGTEAEGLVRSLGKEGAIAAGVPPGVAEQIFFQIQQAAKEGDQAILDRTLKERRDREARERAIEGDRQRSIEFGQGQADRAERPDPVDEGLATRRRQDATRVLTRIQEIREENPPFDDQPNPRAVQLAEAALRTAGFRDMDEVRAALNTGAPPPPTGTDDVSRALLKARDPLGLGIGG